MARLQRRRSSADFIINTAGYSFQQGQVIACSKLGQPDQARRVLDHVFNEAPPRIYKLNANGITYAEIARTRIHLATGHHNGPSVPFAKH
jgi:hypothetical protein